MSEPGNTGAPAAPDWTAAGVAAALVVCTLILSSLLLFSFATNSPTPSSHRRRKLVEIDVIGLHAIDLKDRQYRVDHRRRTAGVGVDLTGQFFLAQMTQHHLVHETGFAIPIVVGGGMRQRRHEFEILELRADRSQFVEVEEIRTRSGAVEEPHRPLFPALDMIRQDRPERRHAGPAADQQHWAWPLLAPETGAIGALGD